MKIKKSYGVIAGALLINLTGLGLSTSAMADGHVELGNDLIPVKSEMLSLTAEVGDMAAEIMGSPPITPSQGDNFGKKTVIYANVDGVRFDDQKDDLLTALNAAVKLRRSILLESNNWDRAKVNKVGRSLFGLDLAHVADSAILLAEWNGSSWVIDRDFDEIQLKLGRRPINEPYHNILKSGLSPSYYARFAKEAYESNWSVQGWSQVYRPSDNIYSIWQTGGTCYLAWRGSDNLSDWIANIQNQSSAYSSLYDMVFDAPSTLYVRVGKAYHDRFGNVGSTIKSKFDGAGCSTISITGHSLGGAMAIYSAYRWYYTYKTGVFDKIGAVYAYNPARVGNSVFVTRFNDLVVPNVVFKAYCRTGDPVKDLPVAFNQQCTNTATSVSGLTGLAPQHNIDLWLQ
jgi:hypothetical protein